MYSSLMLANTPYPEERMNYRIAIGISIILAGLLVSCGKEQPKETTAAGSAYKPALLVVDIQNEYLPTMDQRDVEPGMKAINEVIGMFRKYRYPVIRVHHEEIGKGPSPGTEAFDFPKTVPVTADDPLIIKHHPSAFTKTSLDSVLKAQGVTTVYVCGLSAVGCALATYYGSMDRGYETHMVREGLISHNMDYTTVIRNITGALPVPFVDLNLKVLSADVKRLEDLSADVLSKEYGVTAPDQLNIVGYTLIFKHRLADAIIVLKTNLRLFPDEPNCYDSLGDAYERNGEKELALSFYERASRKAKEKNDPNAPIFEKNYQRLKGATK
jgi:nicotinamidase-related amidase